MVLQYLGTGAAEGWPGIFCSCGVCETARRRGGRNIRTRSQSLVFANNFNEGTPDERMLIDLPPDTYFHCIAHNLDLTKVGHLLITHSHSDHFLPTELGYRFSTFTNTVMDFKLNIYGNEKVYSMFQAYGERTSPQRLEPCEFHIVENFVPFAAGSFTVTALPALHDRRERCLTYMIEHNNRRMLYAHDTGIYTQEVWDFIKNKPFDLVSFDCTSCDKGEGTNHMGLPDIIKIKSRLFELNCLKPDTCLVLNHFSHNGGVCYDEMVEPAEAQGMDVSYDGGIWQI